MTQKLWKSRSSGDPLRTAYDALLNDLRAMGLFVRDSDGPLTIARKAAQQWPIFANDLSQIFDLYSQFRYQSVGEKKNEVSNNGSAEIEGATSTLSPQQAQQLIKLWHQTKTRISTQHSRVG